MTSVPVWVPIVALLIASISAFFGGASYFAGRRERRRTASIGAPDVRATINATGYINGWRSVQLHIVPSASDFGFPYGHCNILRNILRARLVLPSNAVLARAKNDDYATGEFYPERPLRALEGRPEGAPQRFALEFFIRFNGEDKNQKAKFRVDFARINNPRLHTAIVSAVVPSAESAKVNEPPDAGVCPASVTHESKP